MEIPLIQNGSKVSLEYTVFLDNGLQVDSNTGEPPLLIIHGEKQIFPALEKALLGLHIGDRANVTLTPDEAYGPIVQEAYREVPLEAIPSESRFVGANIGVQEGEGSIFQIRVKKIHDDKAVLDFNHPLAGKSLRFDLKVVYLD